jgi:Fe(3+) dicitrate transport protein
MNFYTTNLAPFVENMFRLGKRLSITPGARLEYLKTIADGYDENLDQNSTTPYVYSHQKSKTRTFLLAGLGLQFKASENSSLYANYNQSYRPITYDQLTPFGTIAKIDPNMKDASADNVDIGFRGHFKNIVNFDVGVFYLNYKNRIGTIYKSDTVVYAYRTNTGNSEHKGVETYIEINILDGLIENPGIGRLSIYNSYAWIHAKYVSGNYSGNWVEYAPRNIERVGLSYRWKNLNVNLQYSYTSSAFGDASNAQFAQDALTGIIPSYQLIDVSASLKIKEKYLLKAGVSNLADAHYFTLRTTEYPGPGIIPSIGRMLYCGLTIRL